MTHKLYHKVCGNPKCRVYTAYIRVKKKLVRIGLYYSICDSFLRFTRVNIPADEPPSVETMEQ